MRYRPQQISHIKAAAERNRNMLPERFKERMKEMLGAEYEAFLAALEGDRYQALRLNPLKRRGEDRESLSSAMPFSLTEVPWAENGFYYEREAQPGKHPYHEAGVYYIQEPSAMAAVPFLEAQGGERILDLCAAPGGKTTQIAAQMGGMGLLVCNEIHPARAKILSENIERMGVRNALVLNETPQRLAERFSGYFDRILVDAPCSGEGMFRKNEEACGEWSPENVRLCAGRQREILDCAVQMLRPGGRMVYSTCTFAPEENEGNMAWLIKEHPDMYLVQPEMPEGFRPGRPEWAEWAWSDPEGARMAGPGTEAEPEGSDPAGKAPEQGGCRDVQAVSRTMRLWPHRIRGEGHFVAVLEKEGGFGDCAASFAPGQKAASSRRRDGEQGIPERECAEYLAFRKEYLTASPEGTYLRFGDQLYLAPQGTPTLRGLKVLRPGLHLGTVKKNRFEPSHALSLTLGPQDVRNVWNLKAGSRDVGSYLNGEALHEGLLKEEIEQRGTGKGWYLICVDGFSLGWGKLAGGIMKNHYPKGLRRLGG